MEVRNNKLYLGGIRARDLLDAFGSPLYVYEEDTLRERARELIECISYRNKEIKYACKANTNISLMRIFFEYDMGIDAVSPGEILAALKAKSSQLLKRVTVLIKYFLLQITLPGMKLNMQFQKK